MWRWLNKHPKSTHKAPTLTSIWWIFSTGRTRLLFFFDCLNWSRFVLASFSEPEIIGSGRRFLTLSVISEMLWGARKGVDARRVWRTRRRYSHMRDSASSWMVSDRCACLRICSGWLGVEWLIVLIWWLKVFKVVLYVVLCCWPEGLLLLGHFNNIIFKCYWCCCELLVLISVSIMVLLVYLLYNDTSVPLNILILVVKWCFGPFIEWERHILWNFVRLLEKYKKC